MGKDTLAIKSEKLTEIIKSYNNAAVAFSGGVDSAFLAKICFEALGENALAITVDTPFMARSEIENARRVAGEIGIRHQIISLPDLGEAVLNNPKERCYLCKTAILKKLWETVNSEGLTILLDGSNLDDLEDFRPGLKALAEQKVKSPLQDAGFTKQEIRRVSKRLGLSTWEKPSQACLASRIPHSQAITSAKLKRVEAAEDFLKRKGFIQLRVRAHQDIAIIEAAPDERAKFFSADLLDEVGGYLKDLGFRYVTLDLEGYKTGKLNR